MKTKTIKLPNNFVNKLVKLPESGMGFQIVRVILRNGKVLNSQKVLNSELLILEENQLIQAIDIANMIGTGAFTSLGFQLKERNNPMVVISLWILGGILALSGAFSYAEVGTAIKKSGGEYAFLSKIYHPLIGYLSGWISLTVGFAAPVALAAIAFSEYFPFGNFNVKWMSIALVAVITLIHTRSLKLSAEFQNISTLLKVILIVIIIGVGLILPEHSGNDIVSSKGYFTSTHHRNYSCNYIDSIWRI